MTEATKIDDVYQAHKAQVLNIEDNNQDIINRKYPAGHYINQMKEHAKAVIPNDEAATMNCATFTDFDLVCDHIGNDTEIRIDQVYPALRHIGYNMRYHTMKLSGRDMFTDIAGLVGRYRSKMDRDMLLMVSNGSSIFYDVRSKKCRVSKQVSAVAINDSNNAGIRTSDLNLYLALVGLKTLVDSEPYYILYRDNDLITDVLGVLRRADKSMLHKRNMLSSGLQI